LIVFAAVKIGSTAGSPGTRIKWQRLLTGFAGLSLTALVLAAVSSYASPQEARLWGITEGNYNSALMRTFVTVAIIWVYAGVVGCALVGVPLTVALAKRGYATVPFLVIASVPISFLAVLVMCVFSTGSMQHFFRDAFYLIGWHAFLALGFGVGARLPWRISSSGRDAV